MNSFYSENELEDIGFKKLGDNIQISRKASIYSPEKMSFGSNIRIDDFCLLNGNIELENNIYIAGFTALHGEHKIMMKSFSAIASHGNIYSSSDDYLGDYMANPTVPDKFRNGNRKTVIIGKHAVIGASCVLLPGGNLGEGTSVGSMSLINKSLPPWTVCAGVPAKPIKERNNKILELEQKFHSELEL